MPVSADSHKELLHQERKSVALPGPGCFSPSSTCTASQAAAEVISVSPGLLEVREGSKPGPAPEGIPTFCPTVLHASPAKTSAIAESAPSHSQVLRP